MIKLAGTNLAIHMAALGLLAASMLVTACSERASGQGRDAVLRDRVDANWSDDGEWMWYRVNVQGGSEYYKILLSDGMKQPLFDAQALAAALADELQTEVETSELLRLRGVEFNASDNSLSFTFRDIQWQCTSDYEIKRIVSQTTTAEQFLTRSDRSRRTGVETELSFENSLNQDVTCYWLATDGRAVAYETLMSGAATQQHTFAGHVWSLRDSNGDELARLQAPEEAYRVLINAELLEEFNKLAESPEPRLRGAPVADLGDDITQVFVRDHNLWTRSADEARPLTTDGEASLRYHSPRLSPSGRYLAALQVDVAEKRQVQLIDSRPANGLQPEIRTIDYPKPGDAIDVPRLFMFDIGSGSQSAISGDWYPNAWSLGKLQWLTDPERLICLYNARGHQQQRVLMLDPATGETRALIEEKSETFIDYAHKTYLRYIESAEILLWTSERSGFNHLYRLELNGSDELIPITSGPWVVRGVEHVDEARQLIWFAASGLNADEDPYHRHLCCINWDGSDMRIVTEGDGDHDWEFSPDRAHIIDRYSRVDLPPVTALRSTSSGGLSCELERADWSALLASGWTVPERFTAKGRDGETEIYGILIRPRDDAGERSLPVVEKVYAGPHGSHVPKRFGLFREEHALAELGFVVVQVDGMGTSNRGKAFHDMCWKNLADAGFPDRIAWIKAAAKMMPEIDLGRVGIYGGSAGGQTAMRAVLDFHDFYDVAIADCGCHDNRIDKMWWNEAWMGWPVDEAYAASSNVEHADRLQGALLLIVGELDQNVDPASTMQVVDALIKADKDFRLLVMPGTGHGAAGTPYGRRVRRDFLVEHLLTESVKGK